jgi:hypothetical protein
MRVSFVLPALVLKILAVAVTPPGVAVIFEISTARSHHVDLEPPAQMRKQPRLIHPRLRGESLDGERGIEPAHQPLERTTDTNPVPADLDNDHDRLLSPRN